MVGVEILRWLGLSQSIIRQLWLDFALFVKKSETQNKKQNKKQKNKHLFRKERLTIKFISEFIWGVKIYIQTITLLIYNRINIVFDMIV
jgi:5-formaminoimidazole-4-carboxamide-1-beta-D-ribofuranosyl 5'-monophosphate synthetase